MYSGTKWSAEFEVKFLTNCASAARRPWHTHRVAGNARRGAVGAVVRGRVLAPQSDPPPLADHQLTVT